MCSRPVSRCFVVPLALVFRWAVLGPVSYLIPPLRRVVVERASALVINPRYKRKPPQGPAMLRWAFQEAGTAAYTWTLILATWNGYIPMAWIAQFYAVVAGILLINHVRTLAAHRYIGLGEEVSREGQLLDSVNLVSESPWTLAHRAGGSALPRAAPHLAGAAIPQPGCRAPRALS